METSPLLEALTKDYVEQLSTKLSTGQDLVSLPSFIIMPSCILDEARKLLNNSILRHVPSVEESLYMLHQHILLSKEKMIELTKVRQLLNVDEELSMKELLARAKIQVVTRKFTELLKEMSNVGRGNENVSMYLQEGFQENTIFAPCPIKMAATLWLLKHKYAPTYDKLQAMIFKVHGPPKEIFTSLQQRVNNPTLEVWKMIYAHDSNLLAQKQPSLCQQFHEESLNEAMPWIGRPSKQPVHMGLGR